jgi:hypothetical protein
MVHRANGGLKMQTDKLGQLWRAIFEATKDEEMFWIGEILLHELEKETGYRPHPLDHFDLLGRAPN